MGGICNNRLLGQTDGGAKLFGIFAFNKMASAAGQVEA